MELMWPVGKFSDALFKQVLAKAILTELNAEALANEIRSKEETTVFNLQINTNFINENLLSESPLKLIDGRIISFKARFPKMYLKTKIEIVISDVYLILAPSKITFQKPATASDKEETKAQQMNFLGGIINKVLNVLEITVKNICVKLVTYEDLASNLTLNPTFTVLIGQIQYAKFKDVVGSLFLYNKKIQVDNLAVKSSRTFKKEEIFYFNTIEDKNLFQKLKDSNERVKEKLFILNNHPNTILTLSSKEDNEYFSLRFKIFEDSDKQMKVQADISSFEVILNQKQLSNFNHFFQVYSEINRSIFQKRPVQRSMPSIMKELDFFGSKVPMINISINVNLVNFVLLEGIKYNYPKLWVFLDYKYPDKLDTSDKIEKHFSYFEENFYIFSLRNLGLNSNLLMSESSTYADINFEDIYLKYILHKSKSPFEKYIPDNIIQTYENLNLEVEAMRNIEAKYYFDIYNKNLNQVYDFEEPKNEKELMVNANSSQYIDFNLSSYLNFYFKNSPFNLFYLNKPVELKAQIINLFNSNSKFGARYFSKMTSTQEKGKTPQFKRKTIVSLYLGEIFIQFHPVFMFNLMSLWNYSLLRRNLKEEDTPNEDKSKIKKTEMLIVDEEYEKKEDKSEEIAYTYHSKFKVLFILDKISLNMFSFRSEKINDFFQRYYFIYMSNIADKPNNQSIYKILPNYLEEIERRSIITIKLIDIEALLSSKVDNDKSETTFYLDLSNLLVLLKSKEKFPILHLVNSKSEDRLDIIKSIPITENTVKIDQNKKQLKYKTLFDITNFEAFYSKHSERVKFSILLIKLITTTALSIKNDITFYHKNIHNLDVTSEDGILREIEQSSSNLTALKKTISVKLFLRSQMNLLLQNGSLLKILDFFDSIQYTMNLFQVINVFTSGLFSGKNRKTRNDIQGNKKEEGRFSQINLELKELNVIIFKNVRRYQTEKIKSYLEVGESLFNFIEDPYFKVNISKIFVNVFQYNLIKQILLSVSSFKVLLKKNNLKTEANYENSKTNYQIFCLHKKEEENFHYLVYKESRPERNHIFTVNSSVKTFPMNSKDQRNLIFPNEKNLDFDKFIKDIATKSPLINSHFHVKIEGLVLNPLYEDLDLSYLLTIKTNILDIFPKVGHSLHKYKLTLEEKCSKSHMTLDCSRCVIDLFSVYNKESLGKVIDPNKSIYYKMRMIILLENLSIQSNYDENIAISSISAKKINLLMLRNLDKGANKLIFLNIHEKDFAGNVFLTKYGFTELLYFDSLFLKYSSKIKEKSVEFELVNEVIEVSFCRDSIKCFKQFFNYLQEILSEFKKLIGENNLGKKESIVLDNERLTELSKFDNKFNLNRKENEDEVNLENKSIDDHQFELSHSPFDKKEEKNIETDGECSKKLFILFNYIKVFLYEGKDFVFEDKYEDNNGKEENAEAEDKIQVEIMEEYYSISSEKRVKRKMPYERQRNPLKKRNYQKYIDLSFYDLEMNLKYNSFEMFPLSVNFQIYKFEISDNIKESIFNKIFTKNNFKSENPIVYFKTDLLNNRKNKQFSLKDNSTYEITMYLSLESMNVLIDQHTLFFILEFFKVFKKSENKEINQSITGNGNIVKKNELKETNNPDSNENIYESVVHKIIIKKIIIEEFFINFCYNSHKIELKNSKNKEFMDVLNLTNLKDLKILLRQFVSENCILFSDLFAELRDYWKEDIKNNQIINSLISSISCLKPFKNIMESFFDIYRLPYYYYLNNNSVSDGVSRAFQQFFINLSSESIYVGEKIFNICDGMCKNQEKEKMNSSSAYDKFVHLVNENKRIDDQYLLK